MLNQFREIRSPHWGQPAGRQANIAEQKARARDEGKFLLEQFSSQKHHDCLIPSPRTNSLCIDGVFDIL